MATRVALGLGLALWSAAAAAAASWDFIMSSPDGQTAYYAEPKSLSVQGPIRRIRLLFDYKRPQQAGAKGASRSDADIVLVDCDDRKFGVLQQTRYAQNMAEGAVIEKGPMASRVAYRDVAAGSVHDKLLQYVCALKHEKGKRKR